jgi:hypothetical protein
MSCRPGIGQHLIEMQVVAMQAQEDLGQVRPRLDPVTLGTGSEIGIAAATEAAPC